MLSLLLERLVERFYYLRTSKSGEHDDAPFVTVTSCSDIGPGDEGNTCMVTTTPLTVLTPLAVASTHRDWYVISPTCPSTSKWYLPPCSPQTFGSFRQGRFIVRFHDSPIGSGEFDVPAHCAQYIHNTARVNDDGSVTTLYNVNVYTTDIPLQKT